MASRAGLRLIVLGVDGSPHSRRAAAFVARLARLLLGSVTEGALRLAAVPVLVVK